MQDAGIYNEHFIISGYMVGIDNDRLAIIARAGSITQESIIVCKKKKEKKKKCKNKRTRWDFSVSFPFSF